jgi:hypothetical protein
MGDVVRLPYKVTPPRAVSKLVDAGHLKVERRHDANAIRSALEKSRSRPVDIFGRPEEDNDLIPPA